MEIEEDPKRIRDKILWDLGQNSSYLLYPVRSPNSIIIDDNNTIYIGTTQGIYIISLKKIAMDRDWTKHFIDINETYVKGLIIIY